ncbi:hypothetical protein D3C75_1296190 [compost metagenome]
MGLRIASPSGMNAANTAAMMSAAAVITGADCRYPARTASRGSPERTYSSRIRETRNT